MTNTVDRWLYIGDRDTYNDGAKIYISVDPSDFKAGKKIFMDFMEDNDFYGKVPTDTNPRSAFIIYTDEVSVHIIINLEQLLMKSNIKPRLLKSGKKIPDRAIKGSIFSYYKYDGDQLPNNESFYDSQRQVDYMDSIEEKLKDKREQKNKNKYIDYYLTPTMESYALMDISKHNPIPKNYLSESNFKTQYHSYVNLIRNANAIQRQLIDALVFRAQLLNSGGKVGWEKLTLGFISENLDVI
ncbi:MAG: hypothetical protein LBB09_01480, partial [Rickettsiales bacterium]|nr:hypothetical protein [Rickettsiales bacterium]